MAGQTINVEEYGDGNGSYQSIFTKADECHTAAVNTDWGTAQGIENALSTYGFSETTFEAAARSIVEGKDPMQDGLNGAAESLATAVGRLGIKNAGDYKDSEIIEKGVENLSDDSVDEHVSAALRRVRAEGTTEDEGWTGKAADAFEENFLEYYCIVEDRASGLALISQWWLLFSMMSGVQAIQEARACARRDLITLFDKGIVACEGSEDDSYSDSDGVKGLLTVATAVIAVGGAAATGGLNSWVVAAALTPVLDAGLKVNAPPPAEMTVAASSGDATINTIAQFMGQIRDEMSSGEQEAIESIQTAAGEAKGHKKAFVGPAVTAPNGKSPLNEDGELDGSYDDGFKPPHEG